MTRSVSELLATVHSSEITKKRIKVLHVDDDARFLKVTKEFLEMQDEFQVEAATSVDAAAKLMKKADFDVIVSDYQMPGKDGLEFLKELRQEGNKTPFIILTGKGMEEVAVQALNLGADHYVIKSLNPKMTFSELAYSIRKAVERKRAYSAARLRQERLKAIFDSSPNAIMLLDLHGNIVECSQETLQLTKASSKKDVIGKSFLEFVDERDRRLISKKLKKTLEQGTIKDVEFALLTEYGAGCVGEISASAIKDSFGEPTGLVVIISDITERRRSENQLRQYSRRLEENQLFLENVFAAFPDAVTVCDLDGNIIKCNQPTVDLYSYSSKNELTGTNLYTLLLQRDRERARRELEKVEKLGSVENFECTMLRREGNEFPAELSVGTIMNSSGNPLGLVIIAKNVTERKRLQEQLIVSEKLAAIGKLAATFSHDIRNPLAVIKNSIYFLRMKLQKNNDEKVMKHLRILDEEINYADLIINDLLDFTRKNPPHLLEANLNETVKSALSSVSLPENVKLILRLEEVPPMLIDKVQLQRVFTNIILNAVQAMPDGGKLTVETSNNHDLTEVTFSDTGVGISEENLQRMFTPFFSTKTYGVGLGLNICKQIVEGHGGQIAVRSHEGEGSTFTIKLPIHTKKVNEELTPVHIADHVEVSQA